MQKQEMIAPEKARLDVLAAKLAQISRSQAARLIEQGCCLVNGRAQTKPSFQAEPGARILLQIPMPQEPTVEKENIPLEILYEDQDVAVVVKPSGMVVHPAAGNESGTLVNALLYAMEDLSGIGGVRRPGLKD